MIIINQLPSAIHWKDCIMTTPFTPTEPTPGWNWVLKVCQHSCKFLMMVKAVHTHLWRHLHTHTQYIYIYIHIDLHPTLFLSFRCNCWKRTPPISTFHPKKRVFSPQNGQVLRHLRLRRIASPEHPAPLPHVPEAGSFPSKPVEPLVGGVNAFGWYGDGASSYLEVKIDGTDTNFGKLVKGP